MTFGERLKRTRLALNMSQTELAARSGISERSLYTYEQNGVIPRTGNIVRLAQALNVSTNYLLGDDTATAGEMNEELFLANVRNRFGLKGAKEASDVLNRAAALFAGGELDEEAKEIFFQSLMEAYWESKEAARAKFSPKSRVARTKSPKGGRANSDN